MSTNNTSNPVPEENFDPSILPKELWIKFKSFEPFTKIGKGGFGVVYLVEDQGKKFALKGLISKDKRNNMRSLKKELSIHRKLASHENIIGFCGITDREIPYLILEYANNGTLRDYLNQKKNSLVCTEKIDLAIQIAKGISFMHSKNIIHRDLHSKNILVHDNRIKISDFGLSLDINDTSSNNDGPFGNVHTDPQIVTKGYTPNKAEDIYSIGLLLWEIYSFRPAYQKFKIEYKLYNFVNVVTGYREKQISGTPIKYIALYERCWENEQTERPLIEEVLKELESMPLELYLDSESSSSSSFSDESPSQHSSQYGLTVGFLDKNETSGSQSDTRKESETSSSQVQLLIDELEVPDKNETSKNQDTKSDMKKDKIEIISHNYKELKEISHIPTINKSLCKNEYLILIFLMALCIGILVLTFDCKVPMNNEKAQR
ncbi:hypothetical protein Glove_108g4 [Diversispora epigaea]|uniref:Protein kinase domain-containing protein n=1 Tax=Diversispora epigaea TaxID=1348612 RepID=A0A397JCC6_9GLOM|nr:hypothetical protein Glove_108g4 [Diversispora epigaea]